MTCPCNCPGGTCTCPSGNGCCPCNQTALTPGKHVPSSVPGAKVRGGDAGDVTFAAEGGAVMVAHGGKGS
jgi:hypothetical protein